jgi:hypothetical protein
MGISKRWREPLRDDNAMLSFGGDDSRAMNHILNYYVEEACRTSGEIIRPELFADLNSRVCNLSELLGREQSRSFTLRALLVRRPVKAVEDRTLSPGLYSSIFIIIRQPFTSILTKKTLQKPVRCHLKQRIA